MPWQAIRELLAKVIYGGKIDSEYDQRLLEAFVARLFNERIFESTYQLVEDDSFSLKTPEGIHRSVGNH